jgi:hypothetical protein
MTAMFVVVSSVDRFDHREAELVGVFSNREAAWRCADMWAGVVYEIAPTDIADTYDHAQFVKREPIVRP